MPGNPSRQWLSDADLLKAYKACHCDYEALGEHIGIPAPTVKGHVRVRPKLRRRIEAARDALAKRNAERERANRPAIKARKAGGRTKYAWPTDSQLVKLYVEQDCSISALGRALGIPRPTIVNHIQKNGKLQDKLDAAKDKHAVAVKASAPPVKLGDPVSREETLLAENKELKALLKSTRGEEVATQRIVDLLENAISRVRPTYQPRPRKAGAKISPGTLVLMLSDAHAGEVVTPEAVQGLNEYNWSVMLKRLARLAESVRSHRDHYGAQAQKLHIFSLGDGLSGNIHEELKDTNEYPLSECTVRYGEDIATWIATEFSDVFEDIEMTCVVGNHPRASQKPRAKLKHDNADWTASEITRIALERVPNITVRAPKSARALVDYHGHRYVLLHGDGVRTTMVGIPWGGIVRHTDKLRQLFALSDVDVEAVFGGHWHNPQIAEAWSIFINGSIKGIDEYSIQQFGGGKPASQMLVALHPKWGVTGAHRIDLQDA